MKTLHTPLRHNLRWLPAAGVTLGVVLAVAAVAAVAAQQRQYVEARVYVTSQTPLQLLADRGFRAFEPLDQPDENYPTIMIDPDKTFQAIDGFGGAFTDATADVFAQCPRARRRSS
jgi:glucosylceramidase